MSVRPKLGCNIRMLELAMNFSGVPTKWCVAAAWLCKKNEVSAYRCGKARNTPGGTGDAPCLFFGRRVQPERYMTEKRSSDLPCPACWPRRELVSLFFQKVLLCSRSYGTRAPIPTSPATSVQARQGRQPIMPGIFEPLSKGTKPIRMISACSASVATSPTCCSLVKRRGRGFFLGCDKREPTTCMGSLRRNPVCVFFEKTNFQA